MSKITDKNKKNIFIDGERVEFLHDNNLYTYRFEVQSDSNPEKKYIIAQNKNTKVWSCSCHAWIFRKTCKHLKRLKSQLDNPTECPY